jgi:hypothetical protein
MADIAKAKRNVAKMVSMNAPEADIDSYISSEGLTIDQIKNFKEIQPVQQEIPKTRLDIANEKIASGDLLGGGLEAANAQFQNGFQMPAFAEKLVREHVPLGGVASDIAGIVPKAMSAVGETLTKSALGYIPNNVLPFNTKQQAVEYQEMLLHF